MVMIGMWLGELLIEVHVLTFPQHHKIKVVQHLISGRIRPRDQCCKT